MNFIFILLLLLVLVVLNINYTYTSAKIDLKNETIISNIAEPYFIEDSISPFNVSLTSDRPNENGGLSYLKKYTDKLNIAFVKEYHKICKNVNLSDDTEIIFGSGTTMMIAALYYALQKKLNKIIKCNTNTKIFYKLHEKLTYIVKNVEWTDNNSDADLSVVVSPNNPQGIITKPSEIKQEYMLYDVVYDKTLFTGKHETINSELFNEFNNNKKIFICNSFSKLGIPGVRFGFLLTRDKEIAEYSREFVDIISVRYTTVGATVGRMLYEKYIKNFNWDYNNYNILQKRTNYFIEKAKKHNIQIFNKTLMVPFVYTDKSIDWWLKNFNVETRKGSDFNDTDDNSRFNLMISHENWDEFVRRFN